MLLDLGLPDRDGIDVLRELRRRGDATPVIILTARDEIQHRIAGLDAGADDYIVKPFDLDEVTARMRSVLRRAAGRGDPSIEHGEICADATQCADRRAQRRLRSTSPRTNSPFWKRCCSGRARCLSRAQLEDRLYGWDEQIDSNAIEVYIHGLRRKLGSDAIRTLRGVGLLRAQKA